MKFIRQDSISWDDPAINMISETGSDFLADNWPSSSCVKTEGYTIIKQEAESLYPAELQHTTEVEKPTLTVVKSEYEVQRNDWDSSTNPKNESDSEECDADEDFDYDHDDVDLSDKDNSECDSVESKYSAKNKLISKSSRDKDLRNFYQKRRDFFEPYVLRFCPFCGLEVDSDYKWKKHTNTEHNFNIKDGANFTYLDNGKAQCNQCKNIVLQSFNTLKSHMLLHLPYTKIFKCKLCSVGAINFRSLIRHIELKHFDVVGEKLTPLMDGSPFYNCSFCGKYVGEVRVLSNHIQCEHSEIYEQKLLYVCPLCGEQFETELSHKEHLENQHQSHTIAGLHFEMIEEQQQQQEKSDATQEAKMMLRCLKCSHLLDSNSLYHILKDHAYTHSLYKRFKCRYCTFDATRKTRVITHTCDSLLAELKCNPKFALKSNTTIQKDIPEELRQIYTFKSDSSDKFYVCPSCGKCFDDQVSWDRHLTQIHNFDKFEALNVKMESSADGHIKYICTICDKQFNTNNRKNIRIHAFYHMPHKIYKCKLCQKSLGSLVTCSCKKISDKKSAFIFVCPKCSMEFSTEKTWRIHTTKMHKLNQPIGLNFSKLDSDENECATYKCSDCDEVVKASSIMFKRMFLHATVMHMPYKSYKCINCRELCDSRDSMMKHANDCKMKNGLGVMAKDEAECSKFIKCQCYVCGYLDDSKERVTKHLHEEHHLNNAEQLIFLWLCTVCEHKSDSKNELRDHILKNHINVEPTEAASDLLFFHCPACKAEFRTKFEWQTHIFKQHELDTMKGLRLEDLGQKCKCIDCGFVFKQIGCNKLQHRMQHLPYKPYKCSKCLMSYINLSFTIKHALTCDGAKKTSSKRKMLQSDEDEIYQDAATNVTKQKKIKKYRIRKRKKAGKKPELNSCDPLNLDATTNSSSEKNDLIHEYWEHISFACPECNMTFLSRNAWHSHITTEHDFFSEKQMHLAFLPDGRHKIARCIECSVNLHGSSYHAQRHKLTHMPYPSFVCKLCMHRSRTQNVLVYHIQRQHFTAGEFKCVLCDLVFKTSYERYKHTKAEHADCEWPNNVCHICMKILGNRWRLGDHMKLHEFNRKVFECGFCERKYYYESERKKHWTICHPVEFASNNRRGKRLVVPAISKGDSVSKPSEEISTNNTIMITVNEEQNQNPVEDTHNVEEDYEDPLDLEDSNSNSDKNAGYGRYWEHISYACPECNKQFLSRNSWYSHITLEHDFFSETKINITPLPGERVKKERVSRCNECGVNVYGSPFQSQRHKLTHMPYQSFICKICTHRSRTQNVLICHIQRRHFTAGEFKCVLCDLVFSTSYERVVHTKAEHTDAEWPNNVCYICMKVLKYQSSLKEHLKTHDFNRETIECGFCNRKYKHPAERRIHWMQNHPVEFASIDGEKKKLVVKKAAPKYKKRKSNSIKKKLPQSDQDTDSGSSSESQPLVGLISNRRSARNKIRTLEVKEENQILVKDEEALYVKNEQQSDDADFII